MCLLFLFQHQSFKTHVLFVKTLKFENNIISIYFGKNLKLVWDTPTVSSKHPKVHAPFREILGAAPGTSGVANVLHKATPHRAGRQQCTMRSSTMR